jgi:hypothetical protein
MISDLPEAVNQIRQRHAPRAGRRRLLLRPGFGVRSRTFDHVPAALDMDQTTTGSHLRRFWVILVGLVIVLIFLYFYQPFEEYFLEGITHIHSYNIIFWFAALVGVVGYVIAHWQSFRRRIFRQAGELDAEELVFDSLQISILIAVIVSAGATLQAIEMLSEHLINTGPIVDPGFGRKLLAIILLVILAVAFTLLHHVVRAFRTGWRPKRPPGRGPSSEEAGRTR